MVASFCLVCEAAILEREGLPNILLWLAEALRTPDQIVPLCHLGPELCNNALENCDRIVGNVYTLSLAQIVDMLTFFHASTAHTKPDSARLGEARSDLRFRRVSRPLPDTVREAES